VSRRIRRVGRYVDALLRDRRPPRAAVDPDDLEALAAAIELSSARPQAGMPDPRFVERLEGRLREHTDGDFPVHRRVTRRGLLQAGGLAAAAAAAGVVVDRAAVDHGSNPAADELAVNGGEWHPVVAADALPVGRAMRFSTGKVEGVVVNRGGGRVPRAVGGVHPPGLHPAAQPAAGRLDCPCHSAAFGFTGEVLHHQQPQPLRPLPRIPIRVRDGHVEVHVV